MPRVYKYTFKPLRNAYNSVIVHRNAYNNACTVSLRNTKNFTNTNRRYQILLEMAGSAAGKRAAIAIGKEAGKGLAIGLVFGFGYQVCSELH